MPNFDIVFNTTVDFLVNNIGYDNVPWTRSKIFVSEGAVLSQTETETIPVLYTTQLVLGENSTGTADIKQGFIFFTKPGFELILIPEGVPVPADVIVPLPPNLVQVTATQNIGVPEGRTEVTIDWTLPTANEPFSEYIGEATGELQVFDLTWEPILTSSEKVYEIIGDTGAATTLAFDFKKDHDILRVVDSSGFSAGDFIGVFSDAGIKFYRVTSVEVGKIIVASMCCVEDGFAAGATVKKVLATLKTSGVDYTINYSLGNISLNAGQFSAGNKVFVEYTPLTPGLAKLELYRVPGDNPVSPSAGHTKVTKDAVFATPGVVVVSYNIPATITSWTDILNASDNGETWTYYLFAVDNASNANVSNAASIMIETIPTIPQNPRAAVSHNNVNLSWDNLPGSSDININGFNVYRCEGAVFIDSACLKVNSSLIPKATPNFTDGPKNYLNRRPNSEVPFPQNGKVYSYKIESEDSSTSWVVGTKNEDAETGGAQLTARK